METACPKPMFGDGERFSARIDANSDCRLEGFINSLRKFRGAKAMHPCCAQLHIDFGRGLTITQEKPPAAAVRYALIVARRRREARRLAAFPQMCRSCQTLLLLFVLS